MTDTTTQPDASERVASPAERDHVQEMGGTLSSAKKLAPSHPHPNAPDTPPGNVVGGVTPQ